MLQLAENWEFYLFYIFLISVIKGSIYLFSNFFQFYHLIDAMRFITKYNNVSGAEIERQLKICLIQCKPDNREVRRKEKEIVYGIY